MQRKRVHAATNNPGAGGSLSLVATIDEVNGANVHGLRTDFIVEPQDADANANGVWALWCIPDVISAVPVTTTPVLELEGSNPFLWAAGTFAGSNQTPFHHKESYGTSRTCQRGARIVLVINLEGVSAGLVRLRALMTYFTTASK